MGGFVYKQRYAQAGKVPAASIPGLNVRHVLYIATRPGAVYNRGCGFSLWGCLQERAVPANITDLDRATALVRAESERGRTLYRAVVSLKGETAAEYGYYERAPWERLVKENISHIAREMHIRPSDLRWAAAMHYAKGHPHVHLIFWDAGKEPRQDFMPKAQFEQATERIRAKFNYSLFGPEIRQLQEDQRALLREAREELRALFPEANPGGAFDVPAMVKSAAYAEFLKDFDRAVRDAPRSGSFKYAYLSPDYKAQMDELVGRLQTLPGFGAQYETYLEAADQVSALYGNSSATAAENRAAAEATLNKALANELLQAIKTALQEARLEASQHPEGLRDTATQILDSFRMEQEDYGRLLEALPTTRIPVSELVRREDFEAVYQALWAYALSDARVRAALQGYAEREGNTYGEFSAALRGQLIQSLYGDAGYQTEAIQTQCLCGLMQTFDLLVRLAGQQQARARVHQRSLQPSKDRSREARRDASHKQSLAQSPEF